jgi:hypothetical protein
MADHYFAVTGSGSGTGADADNPQTYSSTNLNTAEAAASGGDTIFFLPGSYGMPPTFDPLKDDITYQSTELHGAVFTGALAGTLVLGSASRNGLSLIGFKFVDCGRIKPITTFNSTTGHIIKQNLIIQNTATNYGNTGLLEGYSQNSANAFTDNVVVANFDGGGRLFRHVGPWTIDRNSFNITTTNVTSLTADGTNPGVPTDMKNNIWKSNDASVFLTTVALNANSTNSCFYQMGSHNAATGTNIEADPQFVDPADGDLRLRPTSPCIGAGTAS